MIECMLPLQQAQVWELRSHVPCRKKKKGRGVVNNSFYLTGLVQTLNGTIHVNNNGLIIINNNNDRTFTNLIFNNNSLILFKDEMHFN